MTLATTLRICDILPATPRAKLVRLCADPFPYSPGQAVLVGKPGSPIRRAYSIACAPEEVSTNGWIELLVGVDPSGFAGPHFTLETGALVEVEGPHGTLTCPCQAASGPLVFVAGGNGIAPLRAVLRHAIYAHASKLVLLYSARSPEAFAFQSELEALQRTAQLTLYQTVTRSGADCWHGARGRLRTSDLVELGGDSAATWLVSGPAAFVVSVMGMLGDIGVAPEKIRFERGIEAPPAAVRCAR